MSNRENYIDKLVKATYILIQDDPNVDLIENFYLQKFFGDMSDHQYDIYYHQ